MTVPPTDLSGLVAALAGAAPAPTDPVEALRANFEAAASRQVVPPGLSVNPWPAGGIAGERIEPAVETSGRSVLYLHGGGYAIGSPTTGRTIAAHLALAARTMVFSLDYRLAPEHPCPAAIDDAVNAYRSILDNGAAPARLAVVGDSAGGGLVVSLLVALREEGFVLPRAAVCISPWVDLRLSSPSMRNATGDPECKHWLLARMAAWYLDGRPACDPIPSPVLADLRGLPPLLIQVGGEEALRDDSVALAAAARDAGVAVDLEVWPGMIHVWHRFAPRLPEGSEAFERVAEWLRDRMEIDRSRS